MNVCFFVYKEKWSGGRKGSEGSLRGGKGRAREDDNKSKLDSFLTNGIISFAGN